MHDFIKSSKDLAVFFSPLFIYLFIFLREDRKTLLIKEDNYRVIIKKRVDPLSIIEKLSTKRARRGPKPMNILSHVRGTRRRGQ